jgi:hypothetical protein
VHQVINRTSRHYAGALGMKDPEGNEFDINTDPR